MSEQGDEEKYSAWPGFGLVIGGGLGTALGLTVLEESFFLGTGTGAGLGLVVGAGIEQLRRARPSRAVRKHR